MGFDGFRWGLMGFLWDLMRFDGIWWVLMGFGGFWWGLMGFDGFWRGFTSLKTQRILYTHKRRKKTEKNVRGLYHEVQSREKTTKNHFGHVSPRPPYRRGLRLSRDGKRWQSTAVAGRARAGRRRGGHGEGGRGRTAGHDGVEWRRRSGGKFPQWRKFDRFGDGFREAGWAPCEVVGDLSSGRLVDVLRREETVGLVDAPKVAGGEVRGGIGRAGEECLLLLLFLDGLNVEKGPLEDLGLVEFGVERFVVALREDHKLQLGQATVDASAPFPLNHAFRNLEKKIQKNPLLKKFFSKSIINNGIPSANEFTCGFGFIRSSLVNYQQWNTKRESIFLWISVQSVIIGQLVTMEYQMRMNFLVDFGSFGRQ